MGSSNAALSNSGTIWPWVKNPISPPRAPDGQSEFAFASSANLADFSVSGVASIVALSSLIFFSASASERSLAFFSLMLSMIFFASAE